MGWWKRYICPCRQVPFWPCTHIGCVRPVFLLGHEDLLGERAFGKLADLLLERLEEGRVGMPGDLPLGVWRDDRELLVDRLRDLPDLDDVLADLHGLATSPLSLIVVLRVGLPSWHSRASCAR